MNTICKLARFINTFPNCGFMVTITYYLLYAVALYFVASLKIVKEYERGVRFFLGKYTGLMKPGLRIILPMIMSWQRVDLRVKAVDVPDQDAITKDNVSLKVNAVLYYKVADASKAILEVEYYNYAVSQLAQTTMRDVVGEATLDQLLSKRESISKRIKEIVDEATDPWGIKVESVELKHVELPGDLKRIIGKEAEAEREKRAVIIKASGEVIASKDMAKAADTLSKSAGALHLRTLQAINNISGDKSNTVVFAIPLEVLKAIQGFKEKKE